MNDHLQVWPCVNDGQFHTENPPLEVWRGIWAQLCERGVERATWYDGSVKTEEEFVRFMNAPGIHPVLVVDAENHRVVFLAWLTGLADDGFAFAHFATPAFYRRGYAERVLDYWRGLEARDGRPLFRMLYGVTPATNDRAVRFKKLLGFRECGRLPLRCRMVYEGGVWADAVLSWKDLEEERTWAARAA